MVLLNKSQITRVAHVRGGNKIHSGGSLEALVATLPIDKITDFILKNGINFVLNHAPLPELHLLDGIKKYSFCGPFTKLDKRVDLDLNGNIINIKTPPINELDAGCLNHDVAYEKYKDIVNRNIADQALSKVVP